VAFKVTAAVAQNAKPSLWNSEVQAQRQKHFYARPMTIT
jgi:hypothetical protein